MPSDGDVATFLKLTNVGPSSSKKKSPSHAGHRANVREIVTVPMLVQQIRAGFPLRSFNILKDALELSDSDLAHLVGIPTRTLSRRVFFKPDESDRLVRVARVTLAAVDVLGNEEKARNWLRSPNRSLGGVKPMDLLDTEAGTQLVSDVLIRLDDGVIG